MKVRIDSQMMNLFRLSKLGQECPNEFFMDSNGNSYELTSEPNKPRRAKRLTVFWPALYERAKLHVDWDADTMELT